MQADFFFKNGRVVNVYSGEILEQNVSVLNDKIIYVGPSSEDIGPDTEVVDVQGGYVLPGYFDAHAHADLYYNPFSYANYVVTRGTTCFFNDGHDLANALGAAPFMKVMAEMAHSYLSVYTGVPAASPPYPGIEGKELWSEADLKWALTFENAISLSEITPYLRVTNGDKALMRKLAIAQRKGKLIEGHTTGANHEKLNILARAGVTSCHESLNSRDALERIRLGYYVMLRHGSIRQDLPRLIESIEKMEGYDTSRMMLVTDGIFPDHLISWGNMDWVVAEAIKAGLDLVRAIQMATLNPARYFRLDHQLGGIAPGRLAHLQVVSSLENPTPHMVMAKGIIVAKEGRLTVAGLPSPLAIEGKRPFTIDRLNIDRFRMAGSQSLSMAPIISIVNKTVTKKEEADIQVAQGFYRPENDILKIFLITRDGSKTGKGFVKGFCSKLGGIASTISHETHGLLVLGQREEDMVIAANDVLEMRGGISLAQGGEIRARIPLPLGGICSLESVPDLAQQIRKMHDVLKNLGSALEYPLWTLGFLSFTSVLRLRITYEGVYDVKEGKIIFS